MPISDSVKRWWATKNEEWRQQEQERKELRKLERQALIEGYKEESVKMAKVKGKQKARDKYRKKSKGDSFIGKIGNMERNFNEGVKNQFDISGMDFGSMKDESFGNLNTTSTIENNIRKKNRIRKKGGGILDFEI